jgi:hypothetical protein
LPWLGDLGDKTPGRQRASLRGHLLAVLAGTYEFCFGLGMSLPRTPRMRARLVRNTIVFWATLADCHAGESRGWNTWAHMHISLYIPFFLLKNNSIK